MRRPIEVDRLSDVPVYIARLSAPPSARAANWLTDPKTDLGAVNHPFHQPGHRRRPTTGRCIQQTSRADSEGHHVTRTGFALHMARVAPAMVALLATCAVSVPRAAAQPTVPCGVLDQIRGASTTTFPQPWRSRHPRHRHRHTCAGASATARSLGGRRRRHKGSRSVALPTQSTWDSIDYANQKKTDVYGLVDSSARQLRPRLTRQSHEGFRS